MESEIGVKFGFPYLGEWGDGGDGEMGEWGNGAIIKYEQIRMGFKVRWGGE